MKRLLLILATLALATSAMAMIGQTPDQVIAVARKDRDTVRIYNASFGNLREVYVDYKDGSTIRHTFGREGREIAFSWTAPFISNDDVVKIQRAYRTQWYGIGTEGSLYQWVSKKRLQMMAQRHEKYYDLTIFDMDRSGEIKSAIALSSTPTPAPALATYPPADEGLKPARQTPETGRTPNDCYIIASENYARLKNASYWVRVAAIIVSVKSSGQVIGHSVVFSQLTPQSKVVMSDENGALDLPTMSHDLGEIIVAAAAQSRNSNTPYIVQSADGWTTE